MDVDLLTMTIQEYVESIQTNLEKLTVLSKTPTKDENLLELAVASLAEGEISLSRAVQYLTPTVGFVPAETKSLKMQYSCGHHPWNFILKYENSLDVINNITSILQEKKAKNQLKFLTVAPEIGSCIGCFHHDVPYRAVVTASFPENRLKLQNIDVHETSIVKLCNCFELPSDVSTISPQSIICSVIPEDPDMVRLWNDDLSSTFVSALNGSNLTVDIVDHSDGVPPKFTIRLIGYNEIFQSSVDFNEWICERLGPDLMKYASEETGDDISCFLREESLDPYINSSEVSLRASVEKNQSLLKSMDQTESLVVSPRSSPGSPRVPLPSPPPPPPKSNKKTIDIEEYGSAEKVASWFQRADQSMKNGPVNDNAKGSYSVSSSPSKSSSSSKLSPFATEFKFSPAVATFSESSFDQIETDITQQFIPKDEKRFCRYYSEHGRCNRSTCKKEHIKKRDTLWTQDTVNVYVDAFNKICLPDVNQELKIKVISVISPIKFFCHLPSDYSDIGEVGHIETLESLMKDMNSIENKKMYQITRLDPALRELVLARHFDEQWARGLVCDLDDNQAHVFFPDFGTKRYVKFNEIRKILPQFLHLPFQAVTVILANCHIDENSSQGLTYLKSLIECQDVTLTVTSREPLDDELEGLVHLDGTCVNELMYEAGYCKRRSA